MAQTPLIDALNRLLAIHCRSLPMYLADARPFATLEDERALAVLADIVADQKRTVERIAEMIQEEGGYLETGDFPMRFTSCHDLALEYLVGEMARGQRREIAAIEAVVGQLTQLAARSLAEEALGAAKGHLEALTEMSRELKGRTVATAGA